MNRMWAIVERELRKFFRSPALMLVAMVFPLVQLIVLGNAFGGKIKGARSAWWTRIGARSRSRSAKRWQRCNRTHTRLSCALR